VAVDYPILLDGDGKVSLAWKVFGLPSSFIVDRQGQIRYSVNRAIDWDTDEVKAAVEKLLGEPE
jgi:peroxiredoxin